ncbi:MAG: hypothetical protein HYY41_02335 [Chloroflexi bacterium]|nr:hypothetical protein [Chloroflexota bacterium]
MNGKALKYPLISAIIVGLVHLIAEAIFPGLKDIFQPPVVALVLFAFGIWVGYKTVQFGGKYSTVIVNGLILGILPLILQIVGFGMILGRGVGVGLLAGIFGLLMVFFSSLIGGGFALSKE